MDIVVASTTDTVVVETDKLSNVVVETAIDTITTPNVYNVIVEVNNPTTIVSGQPGPQGPVGISEDNVAYARQTDFVGEDVIYKGEAEAGSPLNSPVWRIRKITIVNDDISELWADGNTNFDNIWDNRISLNYL